MQCGEVQLLPQTRSDTVRSVRSKAIGFWLASVSHHVFSIALADNDVQRLELARDGTSVALVGPLPSVLVTESSHLLVFAGLILQAPILACDRPPLLLSMKARCATLRSQLAPRSEHLIFIHSHTRVSELSWAAHLSLNMVMSAPIPRRGVFEFAQAYGSVVLKVMGPLTVHISAASLSTTRHSIVSSRFAYKFPSCGLILSPTLLHERLVDAGAAMLPVLGMPGLQCAPLLKDAGELVRHSRDAMHAANPSSS